MNTYIKVLFMLTLLSMSCSSDAQRKLSIQERLSKLEQQLAGGVNNNSAANTGDLVIQVQQLQNQIAQLQGRIEEQNYLIEELQKRQKVLYVDIDSRIAQLESSGVNNPSSPILDGETDGNGLSQSATNASNDVAVAQDVPDVRPPVEADLQTTGLNNTQIQASNNTTLNPQAEALYENAFSQLKAGRFTESARLFEDFTQRYPQHELTDNSYYWLGESHYVSRNYPLALAAFQTLENQFPMSGKLSDALLKIGYTYHELEDYAQAQLALNKVITSFPGTSVARLAESRVNLLRREGKIN